MHRPNSAAGRLFRLIRNADPTAVAGTGHVASGVHWPDGSVSLKWHTPVTYAANISHYAGMSAMLAVHGHGGKTRVQYVKDDKAPAVKLIEGIADFAYELGDFAEKVEKGLSPSPEYIRKVFGKLLDTASEAKPAA